MTFNGQELLRLSFMSVPETLTDKELQAFRHMKISFYHAVMSSCESATFDMGNTELIALSKAKSFVSLKRKKEDHEIEKSIRKKIGIELRKRNLEGGDIDRDL